MATTTKHIMFSYQWNSESLVTKIYHHLTQVQSIPIWMDKHGGMTEYLSTSMAEGVENCCLLVCFLTPEYQQSINCKKELTYASQLQKPIVPCLLGTAEKGKKWKPTQWLGLTITDLLYLNFTRVDEHNFEDKCQELLEKIQLVLGVTRPPSNRVPEKEEESNDEDEHFGSTSPSIVPSVIRQGPQIDDGPLLITSQTYSSEGDSVVRLLNQSPAIECNQDLYATRGQFFNSFTFPRFAFHNPSSQSVSIVQFSADYEGTSDDPPNKRWIPCQITTNQPDAVINIDPNKLILCSLTIKIRLDGTPGVDNEHRSRAHPLLPQPLRMRIQLEDTQMKHSSLIVEQMNRPWNLPTLEKLMDKLHLAESTVLGFVFADDCSIEVRYFVLIYYLNDGDPLIKFAFGCDLSSQRSPTWNKQYVKTLQKNARKAKKSQLIVHDDVLQPFVRCLALFNEHVQLQAIQITIQTNTSTTTQIVPLPLQQIFAECETF